jgi:hypothetical protein
VSPEIFKLSIRFKSCSKDVAMVLGEIAVASDGFVATSDDFVVTSDGFVVERCLAATEEGTKENGVVVGFGGLGEACFTFPFAFPFPFPFAFA